VVSGPRRDGRLTASEVMPQELRLAKTFMELAALQLTAYFAGELTSFDLHSSQKARRSSVRSGRAPHPVRAEIFIPNGRGACSGATGVRADRRGACPKASRERSSC
jgi:hypothetical protein